MNNKHELQASHETIKTFELSKNTTSVCVALNVSDPIMYALYLTAKDSTQQDVNFQMSRRFVLIDNTSYIVTNSTFNIIPTSASKASNYEWQTNTDPVDITWADHFYNDWFVHTNWLLPIAPDEYVSGIFEQETGELPVSGTPNVDGIVNFMYRYTHVANDSKRHTVYKNVPDPLNESLTLNTSLQDGDTLLIDIKAIDVMNNTLVDSLTLHIDSSPPVLDNTCLVTGNHSVCGSDLVHNSRDFASMKMTFTCKDNHR